MNCHVILYNWVEYLQNVVLLEEQLSKSLIGTDQYPSSALIWTP